MDFTYSMPTKLLVGDIRNYTEEFKEFGRKAFIVTGRSSASKNGSLNDVISILKQLDIEYTVYNQIDENPDIGSIEKAVTAGLKDKPDFIIGIGGGSPMDAAKAISLLIKNPEIKAMELYAKKSLEHIPLLLVPTTAGSGSEATPFCILTVHEKKTKISIAAPVFAQKAFINAVYLRFLPKSIALSTAIDALTHLVEGYLSASANFISDRIGEGGLKAFGECVNNLRKRELSKINEKLMLISSMGGMVISHAKTTLPHQMGYALTYNKNIAHGFACGLILGEYMRFYPYKEKVCKILQLTGFDGIEQFIAFLNDLIDVDLTITRDELKEYSASLTANPVKLKNHPCAVNAGDLLGLYERSLANYINK